MRPSRRGRPRTVAAAALIASATALGAADAPDPWRALELLRAALAADGSLGARFEQSYVPAGFEIGDVESGTVAVAMPDCLRWDYVDPYRKSFLVCGDRAWSWVEGEPRGQRFPIEAEREMGLDLLLLPTADLAQRYRARSSRAEGGEIELELEPLASDADLAVADLTLTADGRRPLALAWRDREGSVTGFRFEEWRKLSTRESFEPPLTIEWSDPDTPDPLR